MEGEGEWNARKHGGSKRRVWRKIHIGIDEETLEVRAVEITPDQPAFGLISRHPYHSEICAKAGDENVAYFPRSRGLIERFPSLTHDIAFAAVTAHASKRKTGPVGEGESVFYDANGDAHVFNVFSFSNTYDLLTYGIYRKP